MAVTLPYYEFREVLSVRDADASRLASLADLRGQDRRHARRHDRATRSCCAPSASTVCTWCRTKMTCIRTAICVIGRVDAVLLDNVLAERRHRAMTGFTIQPQTVAIGHYVGVLAPQNAAASRQLQRGRCAARCATAALERILRTWSVWNDDQPKLYERLLAGVPVPAGHRLRHVGERRDRRRVGSGAALFPVAAAGVGSSRSSCRACRWRWRSRSACSSPSDGCTAGRSPAPRLPAYVELIRGTPILLQLFVLYYGLASAIRLPAFVAALLGLALNYAAYESEIYRSALEAISTGQLEAARTLGLSERQVLTLVRAPQAFRLALAPMTNDFVALLKDSSLVSVLTVLELTKQTQIFATNLGSWVIPGTLCAGLYLAMSLPLAAVARRLELRWKTIPQ